MSEGSPWFRFGVPLGSALIIVALLDTAWTTLIGLMDFGWLIHFHILHPDTNIPWPTVISISKFTVWALSNLVLLWYGGIAKGNMKMLATWIAIGTVSALTDLGLWLYFWNMPWMTWSDILIELYSMFMYFGINGYMVYVGVQCFQCSRGNTPMEPIGQGFKHILKFHQDDPTCAARLLLISELVLIAAHIFTRQISALLVDRSISGHEGDRSVGIILEEVVTRVLRFIVSAVGLCFIVKGNLRPFKYWLLVYAGTILTSVCLFIYLLITWNSEYAYSTVGYFSMFAASLVYRCSILYVCTKVNQTYTSTHGFLNFQNDAMLSLLLLLGSCLFPHQLD